MARPAIPPDGLLRDSTGVSRCFWGASSPDYIAYHDGEWGFPVGDDARLFEKLALEGFMAGLSWLTILRKREAFRTAFAGFDHARIARFDESDVARLLGDAGIVRHRGKIEAVINNARRMEDLLDGEGSLAAYVWRFEPPERAGPLDRAALAGRSTSPAARRRRARRLQTARVGAAGSRRRAPPFGGSGRPPRCPNVIGAQWWPGRRRPL